MRIRVTYLGRSYQQAASLPEDFELPSEATVKDALAAVNSALDEHPLPESCLVTIAGEHLGSITSYTDRPLQEGDELMLIAPVAGG